jgi:hypothetical protein
MEQKTFTVLTEEMLRFVTDKYTIRIWLPSSIPYSEKEIFPTSFESADSSWTKSQFETMINTKWKNLDISELGMRILAAYEANAVEVLDKEGNGKVFYNNWP